MRELVGAENFYSGIAHGEQQCLQLMLKVLRASGIPTPSLRDIESHDAVLILGEDITQTGARIALSVRQAVKGKARAMAAAQKVADWQIAAVRNIGQHARQPLFITNVDQTRMDDIAAWSYLAPVDEQARLGFAIAHGLDNTAPAVPDLASELKGKVDIIVQALAGAKKPLIISGSSAGSEAMIAAAANVAMALKGRGSAVSITFIASAANSFGLAMMGGGSLDQALELLINAEADSAIIMENDLYRHGPADKVDAALAKADNLILLDHQRTAIMDKATLILPAASFAESDGTLVNQECRAQRFFQVYDPVYYDNNIIMLESWRWLHLLQATSHDCPVDWTDLDHVVVACATALPQFQGIIACAPDARFRIHGQKLARAPHCYSGRTAMRADISVHEPRQSQDPDTPFAFSMEGNNSPYADRQQIPFAWAPGWNSPQAWNKFQAEVGGPLRFGDPGVRLIEAGEGLLSWFAQIPAAFHARAQRWLVAPYYHLFGSEELSQRSQNIQQRMPEPYAMVSAADAAQLGVNAGTLVEFSYDGHVLRLPVRLSTSLTPGQIGLPFGLPGISPVLTGALIENLREAVL